MDGARERLLRELRDDTWVMLKPSAVAGIGVIAMRDIPKGCRSMFSKPDAPTEWIAVPRADIDALPEASRHIVENYCLYDEATYHVPAHGFKKVDLAYFLNHSETPNVRSVNDGDWIEALRDISVGEELFIDYGELVDDDA